MSDLYKAAQQALETLDKTHTQPGCEQWQAERKASVALRAALVQLVQEPPTDWEAVAADQAMTIALMKAEPVEPVAWMVYALDGKSVCVTDNPADFTDEHRALPLYIAPPCAGGGEVINIKDIVKWSREAGGSIEDPSDLLTLGNLSRFAALAQQAEPVPPSGYAYRYYPDTIRFNDASKVDGVWPIESIPYWFGAHPTRQNKKDGKNG